MENEPKIEKGIPIPKANSSTKSRSLLHQMEVGDSILIAFNGRPNSEQRNQVQGWAYNNPHGKENGWKFTVRKLTDGFRIWRVK